MIARIVLQSMVVVACFIVGPARVGARAGGPGDAADHGAIGASDLELPEVVAGPMLRHPEALGTRGGVIVARFEALIQREAFLPGPTDPCRFVDEIVECLRDEGLPAADLARTLDRLVRLVIPFEPDRSRALDHVRELAPDALPVTRPARSDGGGRGRASEPRIFTMVDWVDSAGSPFGIDLLPPGPGEPAVAPGSVVPPQLWLCLHAPRDFAQTREVEAEVEVELRGGPAPGKVVFCDRSTRTVTLGGLPRCGDLREIGLTIPPRGQRPAGALDATVTCRILERDPEAGSPPLEQVLQERLRFVEVEGPEKCQGFRVVPLDGDGRELPRPELAHPAVAMAFRSILFYAEAPWRESMLDKARARQTRQRSLGAPLDGIDLAWDPATGRSGRLALPAEGRVLVVLGASWCGPCRELAPHLGAHAARVRERGIEERIVHLSIEDDDDLAAHAADPGFAAEFPDGVVSQAWQAAFGIDAVPRYLFVEEGRVVETDILSPEVFERLTSRTLP